MSKSAATTALGVLLAVFVVRRDGPWAHEGSGPPPKDLKFVNDHWTPWEPPEAAEGAYIVQKGDTLWDLWPPSGSETPTCGPRSGTRTDTSWTATGSIPGTLWSIPGRPQVVPTEGPAALARNRI